MWWGEEISQTALPPAPDPSRSQRRTLGATRAHTDTLTSATLSLHSTPAFTLAHPYLSALEEGQAGARPAEGCCFSVSCGHFSEHTGLLSEATERPRLGSNPRVFKQVPSENASRPAPCGVGLYCACWARGPSSRPGGIRGSSQVKSLIKSLLRRLGGDKW
jgi:hypothetical protein